MHFQHVAKVDSAAKPVVVVNSLSLHYNELIAVDEVSFQVNAGEIVGLLGPNGAGKTSILEALEGIQKPAAGNIRLLGYAPGQLPAGRRAELGFVFQRSALPPHVKVRQLMELYRSIFSDAEFGNQLAATLGLDHLRDRFVGDLSVGQCQRLSVFCAMFGKPSLMIMDEPTSALDIRSRRAVWDAIQLRKREGGMSGVIATHDMDEAMALCDRLYFIENGKICGELVTNQLSTRQAGRMSIHFKAPAQFIDDWERADHPGVVLMPGEYSHDLECDKQMASAIIDDILQAEQRLGFSADLSVHQVLLETAYMQHISTMA